MSKDEKRRIRFLGEELGLFTTKEVFMMRERNEIDSTAEFYSEKLKRWRLLPEYMEEEFPSSEKIAQFKSMGYEYLRVIGTPGEDCPACNETTNQTYFIDKPPLIPPLNCTCIPWCRLIPQPLKKAPE